MRALVYHGPRDLRLEHDAPEPVCGPSQVKVRPAFVGICGTDLTEYLSQTLVPKPSAPHKLTGEASPVTLGHEVSATIVEIGADVADGSLQVGDQVAILPLYYCRSCVPCQQGFPGCCVDNGFLGLSGGGGGLSDYACVAADAIFKLPNSISLEIGVLVEPLAVAWHAVSESGVQPGQDVLVFGTGPIGLAVIQCLRAMNVGQVMAVEIAQQRQEHAQQFGASHILDPSKIDVVQKARELTGGRGPPVAFDCAGVPSSLDSATKAVCARGTIMNVAIWKEAVPFMPNNVVFHEKRYVGSLTYTHKDFAEVIKALDAGRLKPDSMITRKIPISRAVEDGFECLLHEKDKQVKIVIDMALQ
ncbi:GroES-like protein [Xylariaceae sp. FL0016]|nr:GroES-like protein [Xylariaceae sp. FL0016]